MSRRPTSPASVPPLDNEDLLQEILLRLPPQPSSLPRASVVSKFWRRIISDPHFLQRFWKHHREPPLLGFFVGNYYRTDHVFASILDPPDNIHFSRFSLPWSYSTVQRWNFVDCRHGLAVLISKWQCEAAVWNPLTGRQHHINFPPGLNNHHYIGKAFWHAAVFCADAEHGHVHGDCFSRPFKLVLICNGSKQSLACLYESSSAAWGDIVSTLTADTICYIKPSVLAGNALCWLLGCGDVLAFDLEKQSLGVIEKPVDPHITNYRSVQLFRREDGGLGLAVLSKLTIKLWERKSNCDGTVRWLILEKTVQLNIFPCTMRTEYKMVLLVGYDVESNAIFLSTTIGNFMIQLDLMQIRHIIKRDTICYDTLYPYRSFYPPRNIALSLLHKQQKSS